MDLTRFTPAHRQAFLTDTAWQHELTRLFGKRAGDVRYTAEGKGKPGTILRNIYEVRMLAQAIWHAELDAALRRASAKG